MFQMKNNNIFFSISISAPEKLLYLRLRLGQPLGSKIGRDEMINTYGEQKLLPDYWFIVTLSRAEIVSDFFHQISDSFRMYGRVLQSY